MVLLAHSREDRSAVVVALEQLSVALARRDCDLFAAQFAEDALYYGVLPGRPMPVAKGREMIVNRCNMTLQLGDVLSAPRNDLAYNAMYQAGYSSFLFLNGNVVSQAMGKMMVAEFDSTAEKIQVLTEFGSDQSPPQIYSDSLLGAFVELGHNCTRFVQLFTPNATRREPGRDPLHGRKEMLFACLYIAATDDPGWSALAQLYYNANVPDAIAAEFADTAGGDGDNRYARGGGLFTFVPSGQISSGTIFGGL